MNSFFSLSHIPKSNHTSQFSPLNYHLSVINYQFSVINYFVFLNQCLEERV